MVRIIGFHMPESCDKYRHFLQKKFNLNDKTKNGNYQPYSFQWRLYTRILIQVSTEVVLKYDNTCEKFNRNPITKKYIFLYSRRIMKNKKCSQNKIMKEKNI